MLSICRLFLLAFAPFALTACTPSSSSAPVAGSGAAGGFDQTKLETCIPEMIRLMEAKEYAKLMTTFSTAEQLKQMTNGKPVEEAVKDMEPMFPKMLDQLKKAKDIKPVMENDGKKATYVIVDKPGQKETIIFTKIGEKWYAGK